MKMENLGPNSAEQSLRIRDRISNFLGRVGTIEHAPGLPMTEDHDIPQIPAADESIPPAPQPPVKVFEGYRELLDAAAESTEKEIVELRGTSTDVNRRAESYYIESGELGRNRELSDDAYNTAREALKDKYGSLDYLYSQSSLLSQRLSSRTQEAEALQREHYPVMFLQANELDPKMVAAYVPSKSDLGEGFSLPYNDKPPTDYDEVERLMKTLPFVNYGEVRRPEHFNAERPEIRINGQWQFPTERIIGVESFEDWSGRGRRVGKGFSPRHLPDAPQNSVGAITDYAQEKFDHKNHGFSGTHLTMVRDVDGELWGFAHTDGSHRLAAAKLRGEKEVTVTSIDIGPDEAFPTLPFSVRERFAPKQEI